MFRPKLRVKSLPELNAWLEDQCIAYAKRIRHPEFKDRTIWDVFQEERACLMELRGPFDRFVEKAVRASTTCLIMADRNRYSVDARAAGRMVLVRSHAERIVVLLGRRGGRRPFAPAPGAILQIGRSGQSARTGKAAGRRVGRPRNYSVTMSSSLTSSATCRSVSPAASCCST